MKKNKKKILAFIVSTMMILAGIFTVSADGEYIISESGSYTYGGSDPVVIGEGLDVTLTLNGASIDNAEGAAISIGEGTNVTLVLEGTNVLKASTTITSAGIFVPYGSTLTIEGDGKLDVTGGKYGAGIGSYGTGINVASELRLKCGEIVINSGDITAHGGARGAGIGSGYHVDGNRITINGGIIHAYGAECGAGIGSGYGTSGGAAPLAAVGDYTAGIIEINGGEIYAAAYNFDFTNFNHLDAETISAASEGTFAAGIGGGYGASGGTIIINGGKVYALGACGGAAIGSGRGTSKAKNYDKDTFNVSVYIGGDAEVVAVAVNCRGNESGSGAAIGSGRGTHTGGTIEITDTAKVTAIALGEANAIGAGSSKSPVDGTIPHADSITITDGVTLYALSLDYPQYRRKGVDDQAASFNCGETIGNDDAIAEDQVVVTIGNIDYAVPSNSSSLWANIKNDNSGNEGGGMSFPVLTARNPMSLSNDYAYILGKDDRIMGADMPMLRGEASSVLYRLLKQNDALRGFTYSESAEPVFSDLEGRWDRSAIEFTTYLGIYDASAERIYVDSPIARGEAFKLFAIALDMTDETGLSYDDYANMLIVKGYVIGDENGNININNNITRAEYCKIYNLIIGRDEMSLIDIEGNEVTQRTYGFTDFDENDWFYEVMLKATSAYTNGKVDPSKRAVRNAIDDYEG